MIRYCIFYVFNSRTGAGNGWVEVSAPGPIRGERDLAAIQNKLKEAAGVLSLTITGWQRFED